MLRRDLRVLGAIALICLALTACSLAADEGTLTVPTTPRSTGQSDQGSSEPGSVAREIAATATLSEDRATEPALPPADTEDAVAPEPPTTAPATTAAPDDAEMNEASGETSEGTATPTPWTPEPEEMPTVQRVEAGTSAPDFTLSDLNGALQSLSNYRGKAVMLNFWASWCGHCRSEIPALSAVYSEMRDAGFEIVAVSIGEQPAELSAFVQEQGMQFPVLADTQGVTVPLYQLSSVPTSFFLDREGVVSQVYGGAITADVLREVVSALLDE